jgi:hypothetical protein
MDALVERLDTKLRAWNQATAEQVRERVAELIDLADHDAVDLVRSQAVEQEVLDSLDEPTPSRSWLGRKNTTGGDRFAR